MPGAKGPGSQKTGPALSIEVEVPFPDLSFSIFPFFYKYLLGAYSVPRALWVWPGESLSLVCRSAGSCLLCSACSARTLWARLGVVMRWAQAGLDQRRAWRQEGVSGEGALHPLVEAGECGPAGVEATYILAHARQVRSCWGWQSDPWASGEQRSNASPFPGPLGQRTKVLGGKPMWKRTGCVIQRKSAPVPSSFPPCVWKHTQTALLLASAGSAYFPSGCCWLDHRMALAGGCEPAR